MPVLLDDQELAEQNGQVSRSNPGTCQLCGVGFCDCGMCGDNRRTGTHLCWDCDDA